MKARQDYERLTPLVQADAASKQDLDSATAALTANEASVRANKANVDQTALSTRTQINAMKAKVESLKASLRTAELNLQYGTIPSPIDGRIGDSLDSRGRAGNSEFGTTPDDHCSAGSYLGPIQSYRTRVSLLDRAREKVIGRRGPVDAHSGRQ